MRAGSTHVYTG